MESDIYIEALSQLSTEYDCKFIHVALVPIINNEHKTKPLQHSIRELRSRGIQPDLVICRCATQMPLSVKQKIKMLCRVEAVEICDTSNLYLVPKMLQTSISTMLNVCLNVPSIFCKYAEQFSILDHMSNRLNIAIVGKYDSNDAYKSIYKSLEISSIEQDIPLNITYIDADSIISLSDLNKYSGIIIPGGFGGRSIENMILVCKYCRENNIPCLGICLGMQLMIIEYARYIGFTNCNSEEFSENNDDLFIHIPEDSKENIGGTMRMGERDIIIKENTKFSQIYNSEVIKMRFRHRFEINPKYINLLKGITFSGRDRSNVHISVMELDNYHPFYFGVQFHPEFSCGVGRPSLLFNSFIKTAII